MMLSSPFIPKQIYPDCPKTGTDIGYSRFLPVFNLLQIRPIKVSAKNKNCSVAIKDSKNKLIVSNLAMGNGFYKDTFSIVYVKNKAFNPSNNKSLATKIEEANKLMKDKNNQYLLIGPGRWGSADPWLGIPVSWSQVSEARIIVEYSLENYHVEPSQGSHFFHNLVQFGIGYLTVTNKRGDDFLDFDFLNNAPSIFEDEDIKIIETKNNLEVCIDGRKGKAVAAFMENTTKNKSGKS